MTVIVLPSIVYVSCDDLNIIIKASLTVTLFKSRVIFPSTDLSKTIFKPPLSAIILSACFISESLRERLTFALELLIVGSESSLSVASIPLASIEFIFSILGEESC